MRPHIDLDKLTSAGLEVLTPHDIERDGWLCLLYWQAIPPGVDVILAGVQVQGPGRLGVVIKKAEDTKP